MVGSETPYLLVGKYCSRPAVSHCYSAVQCSVHCRLTGRRPWLEDVPLPDLPDQQLHVGAVEGHGAIDQRVQQDSQ
jgi:hypothetical protein